MPMAKHLSKAIILMLQGHIEQLLPEVWARVLQQLSLQDLLRARLVSKRFVPLSNLLQLSLDWDDLSEARGGSLALFCSRQVLVY